MCSQSGALSSVRDNHAAERSQRSHRGSIGTIYVARMRVALKHLAQDELRRFLQSWQLMYPHETNRLPIGLETTGPVMQGSRKENDGSSRHISRP